MPCPSVTPLPLALLPPATPTPACAPAKDSTGPPIPTDSWPVHPVPLSCMCTPASPLSLHVHLPWARHRQPPSSCPALLPVARRGTLGACTRLTGMPCTDGRQGPLSPYGLLFRIAGLSPPLPPMREPGDPDCLDGALWEPEDPGSACTLLGTGGPSRPPSLLSGGRRLVRRRGPRPLLAPAGARGAGKLPPSSLPTVVDGRLLCLR